MTNLNKQERQPHAVLDTISRVDKSRKIRAILEKFRTLSGTSILEIGTGSGVIAYELANFVNDGEVTAVDVCDQRVITENFRFILVDSPILPFPDNSFDIVISNHVIEHVGDNKNQILHLNEIRRVMKDDGLVYLAVPNKWRLIEPHFKLLLLSWLPRKLSNQYVKLFKKGKYYDCYPPSHYEIICLFKQASLKYYNKTFEAMEVMAKVENVSKINKWLLKSPLLIKKISYPLIPTMIFLLEKNHLSHFSINQSL